MGKSSIIIVLGFMVIVGLTAPNINRLASRTYDNFLTYNGRTHSHDIAVSGANVAANAIFITPTWRSSYNDVVFSGGSYSVSATTYNINQVKIVSVGQFGKSRDTVIVILAPSSFSKFAYFSTIEGGIYWITGDTVWGPFHTQAKMQISGSPVFYGKVTTRLGTNPKKSSAKFYGGYQMGVSLTLPSNFGIVSTAASSGGYLAGTGDLWLKFSGDTVNWKTSAGASYTADLISTLAPNGVICAQQGNVHVEGTLHGRVTVGALGSSGLAYGNIYIDNDIRYSVDPRYGNSPDMLGLAADNNVIITDNAANNNNVIIQAAIICRTGGLSAEHYSTRGVAGAIELWGGVTQYQRGAVGTFSGGTVTSGFHKHYVYDQRLANSAPPFYPATGNYESISWLE